MFPASKTINAGHDQLKLTGIHISCNKVSPHSHEELKEGNDKRMLIQAKSLKY